MSEYIIILQNSQKTSKIKKDFSKKISLYELADYLEQNPPQKSSNKVQISINQIVNLHNADAIDTKKVLTLLKIIKKNKHIKKEKSNLPNIRLIKSYNKFVLFDGHHTLLAHMFNGNTTLENIPFLLIKPSIKNPYLFSGEHSHQLNDGNWKKKTINWKTKNKNKICPRKQKNMQELFIALKPSLNSD